MASTASSKVRGDRGGVVPNVRFMRRSSGSGCLADMDILDAFGVANQSRVFKSVGEIQFEAVPRHVMPNFQQRDGKAHGEMRKPFICRSVDVHDKEPKV